MRASVLSTSTPTNRAGTGSEAACARVFVRAPPPRPLPGLRGRAPGRSRSVLRTPWLTHALWCRISSPEAVRPSPTPASANRLMPVNGSVFCEPVGVPDAVVAVGAAESDGRGSRRRGLTRGRRRLPGAVEAGGEVAGADVVVGEDAGVEVAGCVCEPVVVPDSGSVYCWSPAEPPPPWPCCCGRAEQTEHADGMRLRNAVASAASMASPGPTRLSARLSAPRHLVTPLKTFHVEPTSGGGPAGRRRHGALRHGRGGGSCVTGGGVVVVVELAYVTVNEEPLADSGETDACAPMAPFGLSTKWWELLESEI